MCQRVLYVLILLLFPGLLSGQKIISKFAFNEAPVTRADVGPDAIAVHRNSYISGNGVDIADNCDAKSGLDLVIPGHVFDIDALCMVFAYQREEHTGDFFERGGLHFYMEEGVLFIKYRTTDGNGKITTHGPYQTGFRVPADDVWRGYKFCFRADAGVAWIKVDSVLVWSDTLGSGHVLYWGGAGDAVVGAKMNGNCANGLPIFKDATFYIPESDKAVALTAFKATPKETGIMLRWITSSEKPNVSFELERSSDGQSYELIHVAPGVGHPRQMSVYEYLDQSAGTGDYYYRLGQVGQQGRVVFSQVETASVKQRPQQPRLIAYPNPLRAGQSLYLDWQGEEAGKEILVVLYNKHGREVYSRIVITNGEPVVMAMDPAEKLEPGVYYITGSSDDRLYRKKLVIQ